MDFSKDLSDANLWNADLRYADLRYADLSDANLRNANLSDANLSDADLWNADLRYADLRNANLSDANLWNADLRNANLRYADLSDANLRNANLRYANLRNANLWNANLWNANLRYADLRYADLWGTCLDPVSVPSGASCGWVKVRNRNGGLWVVGWRSRVSRHVGSNTYCVGEVYVAPEFSVSDTECHPGLYLCKTKEQALEYSADVVMVMTPEWEVHEVGEKARTRWFIVVSDEEECDE